MEKSGIFREIKGETIRPGGLALTSHVAAIAGIEKNQTVLEIGCGKGTTAVFLARQYSCRVTGIDLSGEMIACARVKAVEQNLNGQIDFFMTDGEHLPFDDAAFDTVISECTFSLIPNQEKAAGEIRRVLKPSGRFIMTDIIQKIKQDRQADTVSCLAGLHTAEEYDKLFKKSGFDLVYYEDRSETMNELLFNLVLSCDNIDTYAQHLLPKSPSLPTSPTGKATWDTLIRCKPGYAVFIFSKKHA